jgi:hypothetical protein
VIIALALILTHLLIASILGGCSALGPDETAYLSLFNSLYHGGGRIDIAMAQGNPFILKFLYLPTQILFSFGFSALSALRLTMIGYFLTVTFLVWQMARKRLEKYRSSCKRFSNFLPLTPLMSPSLFIWGSLGVRDLIIVCGIVCVMFGVFSFSNKKILLSGVSNAIGLLILSNSRVFVFHLIVITLFVFYLCKIFRNWGFRKRLSETLTYFLIFIVTVTTCVITSANVRSSFRIPRIEWGQGAIINLNEILHSNPLRGFTEKSHGITFSELQDCVTQNSFGLFNKEIVHALNSLNPGYFRRATNDGQNLNPHQIANSPKLSANNLRLDTAEGTFSNPIWLPVDLIVFFISPIPLLSHGFFAQLLSIESILWFTMLCWVGLGLFKRRGLRILIDDLQLFCFIAIISISIFLSLTEVNTGTLVRHRLMLLPLMAVTISSIYKNQSKCIRSNDGDPTDYV